MPNISKKTIDLCPISMFAIEDQERIDSLPINGRANRIAARLDQPGGLCAFACQGVRYLSDDASLAPFSPIGEDHAQVEEAFVPLRVRMTGMFTIPGKRTNRSRVSMSPDGHRQIVRLLREIKFDDLTARGQAVLRSHVAASQAILIGNLPPRLTGELIKQAEEFGTYVALCPGQQQYSSLSELHVHAIIQNASETRTITGESTANLDDVFEALREYTAANVLVMTDDGGPVRVAVHRTGERWVLPPVPRPDIYGEEKTLPVGCGDVLAGIVTWLLGSAPPEVSGEIVCDIVALAQAVATLHYFGIRNQPHLRASCAGLLARIEASEKHLGRKIVSCQS